MKHGQTTGSGTPVALVALGANLPSPVGAPAETVSNAIKKLRSIYPGTRASQLHVSPAFPAGSGPDYINAAVCFPTTQPALEILKILHGIEEQLGRSRGERWAARVMDLDLLGVDEEILPDLETHAEWRTLSLTEQMQRVPDGLILPHPRMQERAFVLKPLAEIAPEWIHPVLGTTVRQMLADLPEDQCAEVIAL